MKHVHVTTCNRDCPDACRILATVEDGQVTLLQGDPSHPVTKGFLCYRTSHLLESDYYRNRLTSPLLRHNGDLKPIGWEQALDIAAERLARIREESGPAAIFHYRSGGSLGLVKTVTDYFFERLGPVTIKRGDICSGAGEAAQEEDFGECDSHDLFDLLNSRQILVWGKNVFTSSPHTIPVLRDALAQGARGVLIDPVHHKTATLCERFIQPRPGGDFALAMAVARILIEKAWHDPEAPRYCDSFEAFRCLAFGRTVEEWCRAADVDPDDAADLARRLGLEKPAAILVGWGMGRRVNGGGIVRALDALGAISGNLGAAGGGVSFYFKRRGAFGTSFLGGTRTAPRTVCEPLLGPELLRLDDPPIRAVWVTAGNPVAMLPESGTIAEALRTREFVVVVDSFLTDTARLAHLVLPTTNLLEADDLLGSYGHHWLGVARPVVHPPDGVRSDLEIVQALASRLELEQELAGSARDWKVRLMREKLEPRGVTLEDLEEGFVRNPLAPKILFEGRKFPTPTGRVRLMTSPPPESPDVPGYPLFLMSLSTEKAQSSQWSARQEGAAVATIHPDAASGLGEGEIVLLESRVGSMEIRLRFDPRQRRDVVLLPKGGHLADGRCANLLVRASTTDMGEGGSLYDERVRIVPLSSRV